jgi:uncharacterized PurR-regulated membrane protein YhhQ (DUF165 family)
LLVQHFGAYALFASSFFLIPFDFVVRCLLHEKWYGTGLVIRFLWLTFIACVITFAINKDAEDIAIASVLGFTSAQVASGIFYQLNKRKSVFYKVNLSDLLAIVCDSIIFQLYAFNTIDPIVVIGQIAIKFSGGLLWYYILFKRLRIHEKINYGKRINC